MGYISLYNEGIDQDLYDLFEKYKNFHKEIFVIKGKSLKVWYNHKKNEKEPQGVYSEAIPKVYDLFFKGSKKVYWDEVYKFYPHVFFIKNKGKRGIDNLKGYDNSKLNNDLEILVKEYSNKTDVNKIISDAKNKYKIKLTYNVLVNVMYFISIAVGGTSFQYVWSKMFKDVLGYDYLFDHYGDMNIRKYSSGKFINFDIKDIEVLDHVVLDRDEVNKKKEYKGHWIFDCNLSKDSKYKISNINDKDSFVIWQDGRFIDGVWKGGKFEKGIWEKGTWKNGDWYGDYWHGGTWENGNWRRGKWLTGDWINGNWYNGTWLNGTWMDGFWHGGIWENGNWIIGWIRDIERVGNYDSSWKWYRGFVRSTINPKEYFKK